MSEPRFLLTRFTHGSAGKFLSTVLQTSNNVDHWSAIVQAQKNTDLYTDVTLEYVRRSFQKDHRQYLRSEPMVPYNTDLYSTGYERGNDVKIDQYIENAKLKSDSRTIQALENNMLMNLVLNKPTVPAFCKNSKSIIITVTSEREKSWLFKTLWSKHFLETDNHIHYIPSDPMLCNFSSLPAVLKFKNQYIFPTSHKEQLFRQYVVNNSTNAWYFDPERFIDYDLSHGLTSKFIRLADILDKDKFLIEIDQIFDFFNLGTPDIKLISNVHNIWANVNYEI